MIERDDPAPVVKWPGGKRAALPHLLPLVPRQVRTYVEPFAGGAALFFAVASEAARGERRVDRAVIGDRNADLVALYQTIRDAPDALIEVLRAYAYDRDLYYATRARDGSRLPTVARAARAMFLSRCGFNGLWRVNARGRFNVPFGKFPTPPRIVDEDGILAASRAFRSLHVRFVCGDFTSACADVGHGDFVYLDPPYIPVKDGSFTGYAGTFGMEDQARVAREARHMAAVGATVAISNADTPAARELYAGMRLSTLSMPRSISRDAASREAVAEIVAVATREILASVPAIR